MAQAQRSFRQTVGVQYASAARRVVTASVSTMPPRKPVASRTDTAPTPQPGLSGYTILTPIKTWKSSRSRKRVVKRVQYGPIFGGANERDIALLLAHNAYAVLGTIPDCAELPVRTNGDIYVSNATGQVFAMGRHLDERETEDRIFFQGGAICMPMSLTIDPGSLATRPVATDLARQRSDILSEAARACNMKFSRQK